MSRFLERWEEKTWSYNVTHFAIAPYQHFKNNAKFCTASLLLMAWMHFVMYWKLQAKYYQPSQAETLYIEEHRCLYLKIKTTTICASEAV